MKTTHIKELNIDVAILPEEVKFKDIKIPKGFRLAEDYEYLCVYKKHRNLLKLTNLWWCKSDKKDIARLCRLNDFDNDSDFGAIDGNVDVADGWLRGVMIVKEKEE